MRKLLVIILLLGIRISVFAFSDSDAKAIVNRFYSNVKIIVEGIYPNGQQTEDFIVARNNALELCYNNQINLPNEFAEFNFQTHDPFLEASAYLKRLFEFTVEKKPKFTISILKIKALEEIKSTKKEDSKNFYEVHVKKTISVGYTKKEYNDVVKVFAENGKITEISNESGGGSGESIISLRGRAAELFDSKRYEEAFDVYLKIVKYDPNQGDAYYRLGLMAYHNLGCKHRYSSGKERRRIAYEYIDNACRKLKYYDIIRKFAENVRYYMINGV